MLFVMAAAAVANAQSMKIVVDIKGEPVGRYIRANATTYTVGVQDDCEIPKQGHKVVTYRAVDGKGIVYRNHNVRGNINVRKGKSSLSERWRYEGFRMVSAMQGERGHRHQEL